MSMTSRCARETVSSFRRKHRILSFQICGATLVTHGQAMTKLLISWAVDCTREE